MSGLAEARGAAVASGWRLRWRGGQPVASRPHRCQAAGARGAAVRIGASLGAPMFRRAIGRQGRRESDRRRQAFRAAAASARLRGDRHWALRPTPAGGAPSIALPHARRRTSAPPGARGDEFHECGRCPARTTSTDRGEHNPTTTRCHDRARRHQDHLGQRPNSDAPDADRRCWPAPTTCRAGAWWSASSRTPGVHSDVALARCHRRTGHSQLAAGPGLQGVHNLRGRCEAVGGVTRPSSGGSPRQTIRDVRPQHGNVHGRSRRRDAGAPAVTGGLRRLARQQVVGCAPQGVDVAPRVTAVMPSRVARAPGSPTATRAAGPPCRAPTGGASRPVVRSPTPRSSPHPCHRS